MRSALLLTLYAAFGHILVAQAGRPQYSVGFDFSLDYAVASINFANDTSVDVATIQGGEAYRQAMRKFMSTIVPEDKRFVPVRQTSLGLIQQQLPTWWQPTAGRLCSYIPSTWFGKIYLDDTARAFAPMLHTLKTATESYLGMPDSLHTISISLPQPISPQLSDSLQTAALSHSLSLSDPRLPRLPAGAYAARGYGVDGKCRNFPIDECDEERLTLEIDYSRAALTALLVHEDTPSHRTLRTIHSEALGEAALDRTCSSSDSDCTAALRAALTNLTQLPVSEDEDARRLTFIKTIVLHGESASDARLTSVLQEVLRRDDDDDDAMELTTTSGGQSSNAISSVYAAARGIAQVGWLVIDEPPPDGCACNDFTRRRMC